MKVRLLGVWLLAVCLGCASSSNEGGIVGSGISTVSGNIRQVDGSTGATRRTAAAPSQAASRRGIRVRILEAPGIEAQTDDAGAFTLSGDFAGALTVQFQTATLTAQLLVDVPAGATVVLRDIDLRGPTIPPPMFHLVDFIGTVAAAPVCAADGSGQLLVVDNSNHDHQFHIQISADTDIFRRASDVPLPCTALTRGLMVSVQAQVQADRSIVAQTIIASPSGSRPGPVKSTLVGNVVGADGSGNGSAAAVRVRIVELPDLETITNADGEFTLRGSFAGPLTLEFAPRQATAARLALNVPSGSTIAVNGVVLQAGVVHVRIIRQRDFSGVLVMPPDCATDDMGTLLIADGARPPNAFPVVVTPDTLILGHPPRAALACADLPSGASVLVQGVVRTDGSIVADSVAVKPGR